VIKLPNGSYRIFHNFWQTNCLAR